MSDDDAWIDAEFEEQNARDARLKAFDDRFAKAAEEVKAKRLADIALIELQDPAKATRIHALKRKFEEESVGYIWKCSECLSMYADDYNGSWVPQDDAKPPVHDPPCCGEYGYADVSSSEDENEQEEDVDVAK